MFTETADAVANLMAAGEIKANADGFPLRRWENRLTEARNTLRATIKEVGYVMDLLMGLLRVLSV